MIVWTVPCCIVCCICTHGRSILHCCWSTSVE